MASQSAQWVGLPHIKGSTESLRMALLTCSLIGLQYVPPFFTRSILSPPGLCERSSTLAYLYPVIQLSASAIPPGVLFTWGTEMTYCTPYLLQLGLSKAKLSLVWIAGPLSGLVMQPIVGVLADKSKSKWGRRRPVMIGGTAIKREATIVLAVLSIYALDFAINAVQASCRSLIVDTLPIPKQQLGSAWGE
ncbi:hypothetical protein H2203_002556 [Taxawa tesnikishii (nom. ined.)]|nr:hypothetical protein H2203_002556 [Dothideales sp. JES 119]